MSLRFDGSRSSDWCIDCSNTHDQERRLALLRPLGNVTPRDVYRELGSQAEHLWGRRDGGHGSATRTLQRDMAELRRRNGWRASRPPRRYSALEAEVILGLRANGLGARAIVRRVGNRTVDAISHFLRKHRSNP